MKLQIGRIYYLDEPWREFPRPWLARYEADPYPDSSLFLGRWFDLETGTLEYEATSAKHFIQRPANEEEVARFIEQEKLELLRSIR